MKNKYLKQAILFMLFLTPILSYGQVAKWGIFAGTQVPFHAEFSNSKFHYTDNNNFNFGAQLKVGYRLHGQTGIGYMVHNRNITQSDIDSSTDIQNNYICIPFQIGFDLIHRDAFKFRMTGGISYRILAWVSPNDLDLKKSDFNVNNSDLFGGFGIMMNRISLDVMCRHPFTPVMENMEKDKLTYWLTIGFFL